MCILQKGIEGSNPSLSAKYQGKCLDESRGIFHLQMSQACLSEIEQMKNLGGDGRLVESQKVPLSAFEYPMDLSSYAAGIYQIRLVSGDDSKSVKIVVE